jgi:hypothetical protein
MQNQADLIKTVITANVAKMSAQKTHKKKTDVLRDFMSTKTYRLLIKPDSVLFRESPNHILDMYEIEKSGDNDRWLEI